MGHTTLFLGKRRIGQIKRPISNVWLILLYTVEFVINANAPNLKILGQVVPEVLDENFHIHYIGVRDRQVAQRATIAHLRTSKYF